MADPIRCAYDLTEGPVVDLPAPCPFCGGTRGTVGRLDWPERTRWAVACASCGAEGSPGHSEAGALGAWKARHNPRCGEGLRHISSGVVEGDRPVPWCGARHGEIVGPAAADCPECVSRLASYGPAAARHCQRRRSSSGTHKHRTKLHERSGGWT